MDCEQLIVSHIGHALNLARAFALRNTPNSIDEAEGIALTAMVEAAGRFNGGNEDGAMFWGFVKPAIFGALVDDVRSRLGRRKQFQFVSLEAIPLSAPFPSGQIHARVTVDKLMRTSKLSPGMRMAIEDELAGRKASHALRYFAVERMRRRVTT